MTLRKRIEEGVTSYSFGAETILQARRDNFRYLPTVASILMNVPHTILASSF